MKTLAARPKTPFWGVLDVIADGLGRPRSKPSQQGWFARVGGKTLASTVARSGRLHRTCGERIRRARSLALEAADA